MTLDQMICMATWINSNKPLHRATVTINGLEVKNLNTGEVKFTPVAKG